MMTSNTSISNSQSARARKRSVDDTQDTSNLLTGTMHLRQSENQTLLRSLLGVGSIFSISLILIYLLLTTTARSTFTTEQYDHLYFPTSIDDLKRMAHIFRAAVTNHTAQILFAFSSLYIFKQTFAIPGSALLNVAAGILFGSFQGVILASVLCAIGGSCCYIISTWFGGPFVHRAKILPKLEAFRDHVRNSYVKGTLFFYLLFLRLFPVTPNFFLNMASCWVGVPLPYFALSMSLGLLPYNFVTVSAGAVLEKMSDEQPLLDTATMVQLACISFVALVPALFAEKIKKFAGISNNTASNNDSAKSV